MTTETDPVTRWIARARDGDGSAADRLMPVIYDQLRALAGHYMSSERAGHTLQPTALVHEAYVRLVSSEGGEWENRAHFFAAAATVVRRILVDHARAQRARCKYSRAAGSLDLTEVPATTTGQHILEVDDALRRLGEQNAQQARLVELRFFGGLKIDEVATALGMSPRTAARNWVVAKAWLARDLHEVRTGER